MSSYWCFAGIGQLIGFLDHTAPEHVAKTNELAVRVMDKGIMTGSRAFGLSDGTVDSDYDYVVMDYDVDDILDVKHAEKYEQEIGAEFKTLSVKLYRHENGEITHILNILVCRKHVDYKDWEHAGISFKLLIDKHDWFKAACLRKETRTAIFQALRDHSASGHG